MHNIYINNKVIFKDKKILFDSPTYNINDDYLGGVIIKINYDTDGNQIGGLMTIRENYRQGNWAYVKNQVSLSTWLGFDDWRLPTKYEYENYFMDLGYPELGMHGAYWSSDKMPGYPYYVWLFLCGSVGSEYDPARMSSADESFSTGYGKLIRDFTF